MTKNTKIILGVGAVAIALYLYNKNKKSKSATSDVVTPTPIPAPDKMPTPIPDLPQADGGSEVFYCKDGTRVTRKKSTGISTMEFIDPCKANGGIDYPKTKKNEGVQTSTKVGGTGQIDDCGSPTSCKNDEVFVNCRCRKRPNLDSFMSPRQGECPIGYKQIGFNKNGTPICAKVNAQNMQLKPIK